jgi:hypothetical protein
MPWRSASDQVDLPYAAELRRLSEWPVGSGPGSTDLYGIDPVGLTITRKGSGYTLTALPPLRASLPERRFTVLICGAAGAISDHMLTHGSRLVAGCLPKYEPLLLLCVAPFPPHSGAIASGIDIATRFLLDAQTTIDAVVWYDIEHKGMKSELARLKMARDPAKLRGCLGFGRAQTENRKRVPIVALRPFGSWEHAAREFASVRAGHLMSHARDEYLALQNTIATGQDDDPNGLL